MLNWPDRLAAPGPKRILSVDGGGVRGAIALALLVELESTLRDVTDNPQLLLSDYFDLIGGTSVGAIISAGLAMGQTVEDASASFKAMAPRLFRQYIPRIPGIQARFDPKRLARLLSEQFGDATLGTAAWRTGFASVTKRVDTGSTWVLTNFPKAKYWNGSPCEDGLADSERTIVPNRNYSLARVVQSSAAAPFFFDLVPLEVVRGESGVFFDGAMTPHGNPALQLAMAALIPAYGLGWSPGADDLMIVSIGAGGPRPTKPTWTSRPRIAILKALHALVSMSFDTSELGIAVLQWLGKSPQPWPINSELGDLSDSNPPGHSPLWTFIRYDAPLETKWLKDKLGLTFSEKEMSLLQRMDDERQIERLFSIGAAAATQLILPEHFRRGGTQHVAH